MKTESKRFSWKERTRRRVGMFFLRQESKRMSVLEMQANSMRQFLFFEQRTRTALLRKGIQLLQRQSNQYETGSLLLRNRTVFYEGTQFDRTIPCCEHEKAWVVLTVDALAHFMHRVLFRNERIVQFCRIQFRKQPFEGSKGGAGSDSQRTQWKNSCYTRRKVGMRVW